MANLAKVLYDNALKQSGVTIAYDGTETAGYEYENLIDYKDFSLFKPEVGTVSNLDFTMPQDTDINTIAIYAKRTGNSGDLRVKLYYESSPSTYTLLNNNGALDGELIIDSFTETTVSSSMKIRLQFDISGGPWYLRQIMVGLKSDMEQGQYVGVNPPTLAQGFVQSNNLSENGSILGTNIKRIDVKSKLSLKHLTESWVRSTWNPFALHASKGRGFFYQWNPIEYPDEVVYCVASKVGTPTNMSPTPLMQVDMDLICRQPDPS